jgi:hypothetical protein
VRLHRGIMQLMSSAAPQDGETERLTQTLRTRKKRDRLDWIITLKNSSFASTTEPIRSCSAIHSRGWLLPRRWSTRN